jgi:Sec-independent protein translocase protein TatA
MQQFVTQFNQVLNKGHILFNALCAHFALIGVITLIVVGPERMPAIAKTAGHYIGKAKRFVTKVQEDIGDEIPLGRHQCFLSVCHQKEVTRLLK